MQNKSFIRKQFLNKRNKLSTAEVKKFSTDIYRQITSTLKLDKITSIASYYPLANEVDMRPLLNLNKNIYLPVVKSKFTMEFCLFKSYDNLQSNKYGILEPYKTNTIKACDIHTCIVPLVAFNRQGTRLGMGGGFYDRYFEHNKNNVTPTKLIGIAYDFQESDTIKTQSWDIPLDKIITNKEVITP